MCEPLNQVAIRPPLSNNQNNDTPSIWSNEDTLKTVICVAANIFLEWKQTSIPTTIAVNVVLRFWSAYQAYQKGEYHKLVPDTGAVLLSCLGDESRIGILVSDICTPILLAYYKNDKQPAPLPDCLDPMPRIDCTGEEMAFKYLDVEPEDANNKEKIDERYLGMHHDISKTLSYARTVGKNGSWYVIREYSRMMEQLEEAYDTVCRIYNHEKAIPPSE